MPDTMPDDWADVSADSRDLGVSAGGLTALTPAPPGPGFFEIGEELALSRTQDGLLTAMVVAGQDGATLETAMFSAPPAAAKPGKAGTPGSTSRTRRQGTPGAASARASGFTATTAWLAAAVLCCAAVAGILLLRRHRS